ncbi:hypothetical protein GSVR_19250 [Geobacter sp. SVR]|nr:hypothetical protein GSVR_19250 [Geobacter sp. SVR]
MPSTWGWWDWCSSCRRCCWCYRFPVPEDGKVPDSVIECLTARFLDDLHHAASLYFEYFFHHLPAGIRHLSHDSAPGRDGAAARVIPFPINRRNRLR